jgi:nitrate/TMAO reductase-like tetraheme cytochrome c subunit
MRLPGLGPDSRLAGWVGRASGGRLTPRALRIATLSAGLVLGFGLVAMVFMVQVSSTPDFCGTCHIMKPYYASWQQSKHNQIACVECHIAPGLTSEIRKKFEAVSMVAKYFTGTYGTNPWAEVDDAACLRCHERRLLEGKEVFHGVVFDHRPHLTETRRGLHLRCTSCHSQIVQGSHIAVTSSTCALCHFKGQKPNESTGRCLHCHEIPERVVTTAGVAFDHSQVKRLDMDCRSCHAGVVRGEGNVPRERCLTCHNQPSRLAEYGNRDLLHRMHVTEHKVDCMNCHLQIEHGRAPPPAAVVASAPDAGASGETDDRSEPVAAADPHAAATAGASACQACHGSGHTPQQDLYSGIGGRGVPRTPGPMYLAGVTCEGCHSAALAPEPVTVSAGTPGTHSVRASAVSCMSCHGPGYKRVFEAWQAGLAERQGRLRAQMDATNAALGVSPPPAWEDARHNFLLVERGHGIHNVNFAYLLLDKAHEQMNLARRSKGLAALEKPWVTVAAGAGGCLDCHQGIEKQAGTFAGHRYAHGPHVTTAKLACLTCHRPHPERAPGEVVRFGGDGCVPCHHPRAEVDAPACMKCHGDVTTRTVTSFRGEFSHKAHLEQGLECATCHQIKGGDPRPQKAVCAQCHQGD